MPTNSQLTYLPLQGIQKSLIAVAAGLRSDKDGVLIDILNLKPYTACSNALNLIRDVSPVLDGTLKTVGPFVVVGFGIYSYIYKGELVSGIFTRIKAHFTARITIPSSHKLHEQIKKWLSENGAVADNKRLCLTGTGRVELKTSVYSQDDEKTTAAALSFIPDVGTSYFYFDGRRFELQRGSPTAVETQDRDGRVLATASKATREADLTISYCSLAGGTEPIQNFLEHVRTSNLNQTESTTLFYRVENEAGEGAWWNMPVTRPARNLDAISMEKEKLDSLVDDIATYLAPESKAYYTARGIPWRRGYLFYGPPGTGKTSVCSSLAGFFGLSVFFISLTTPDLDDEGLKDLFDRLPEKCLVLLEDIDSAGITRETMTDTESKGKGKKPKRTVTLSGLLNVIDGPCSHEGRVLIMTSNSPDSLDAALVRPGRIDRKILFGNAVAEVMESLFMKIFSGNPKVKVSKAELETLSKKFSSAIPDDKMTPAEVQGYLLENRNDPVAAADNASAWATPLIATKAAGKNVAEFTGNITSEKDASDATPPASNTEGDDQAPSCSDTESDAGSDSESDSDSDSDA